MFIRNHWLIVLTVWVCGGVAAPAVADEPKPPEVKPPRVLQAAPLLATRGKTVKHVLRGFELEGVTEVKTTAEGVTLKITQTKKADTANAQEGKLIGDTQVDIELTIPAESTAEKLPLMVVKGGIESAPYELSVRLPEQLLLEKEPNDGFREAQELPAEIDLLGQIHQAQNVDVFRLALAEGDKLSAEVTAARGGSALDASLALYNAQGQVVSDTDDIAGSRDAKVEATAPAAGVYFLVVQDALDRGGSAYSYVLRWQKSR